MFAIAAFSDEQPHIAADVGSAAGLVIEIDAARHVGTIFDAVTVGKAHVMFYLASVRQSVRLHGEEEPAVIVGRSFVAVSAAVARDEFDDGSLSEDAAGVAFQHALNFARTSRGRAVCADLVDEEVCSSVVAVPDHSLHLFSDVLVVRKAAVIFPVAEKVGLCKERFYHAGSLERFVFVDRHEFLVVAEVVD